MDIMDNEQVLGFFNLFLFLDKSINFMPCLFCTTKKKQNKRILTSSKFRDAVFFRSAGYNTVGYNT